MAEAHLKFVYLSAQRFLGFAVFFIALRTLGASSLIGGGTCGVVIALERGRYVPNSFLV
jgi:hypothetical protein